MTPLVLSLTTFAAAAVVFTMTPGLDTATVLRTSGASGTRGGMAASLGIVTGLLIWGMGAAFGLTALLAASQLAFMAIKWLGAAYLLYVGVGMVLRPQGPMIVPPDASANGTTPNVARHAFRRGFLTNILNPKVGLFYITFLPQFIPPGANVVLYSLALATLHATITLIWFAMLVALTLPLGHLLARPSVARALDRLSGCVFIGFGLKLALDEHH